MEALWNQVKFLFTVFWNWLWGEIANKPFLALGVVGVACLIWLLLRPRLR